MEVVAQTLPVPAGRVLMPEVLLGERHRFRRNDLVVPGFPSGVVGRPFQGYVPEPPARTGLLVDVYG